MALTKVTGQVIKNTTDVTVGVLTVTNTLAVGGTVSIGGTLTYEDVTNVDAVGLITARNGIVVGSGITLSKDGDIFATGISTVKGIHINGTQLGEDLKVGTGVTITRDGDIFATGISTFSEGFAGDVIIDDKIVHRGDTNTAIRFPEDDHISFETAGSEAIRIDNGGKLLKGLTDRRLFAAGTTSSVQIEGLTSSGTDAASLSITNNQATDASPSIRFGKTRGTSIGSNTSVADGDQLGQMIFYGADGTDIYNATASIGAVVNGTVATDTIPTDLVFETSTGTTAGRDERLRIASNGKILIGSSTLRNIGGASALGHLQIEGTTGNTSSVSLINNQNNSGGMAVLRFAKTRGTSDGAVTTVADGDSLGAVTFTGADGTDLLNSTAQIRAIVNGTVAGNTIPTDILFETSATDGSSISEKVRITSEGKMGLGTDNPSQILHIAAGGGSCVLEMQRTGTNTTGNVGAINFTASDGHSVANMGAYGDGDNEGAYINFKTTSAASANSPFTSTTEQVRITSGGQLLVPAGTEAAPGYAFLTNSDAGFYTPADNNIGVVIDAQERYEFGLSNFIPSDDNTRDLGQASFRWDDVRATNANIVTSDRNEKNTIVPTDLGLDFINKLSPVSYKLNKGKEGVGKRTHYGLIAQDIETVLGTISKPTIDFAGFCKDTITEDGDGNALDTPFDRYGLRYTEFISPMIKAIQELSDENSALKARVAALESS